MMSTTRAQSGFSLIELLIATGLLLGVSSIVTQALFQVTKHQQTIWNRTEMHSGVRGATELLQQEVGQAGRVTLPTTTITMNTTVAVPSGTVPCINIAGGGWSGGVTQAVTFSSVTGMWAGTTTGIKLLILDGNNAETVTVQSLSTSTKQITACFSHAHATTPITVMALGGFAEGIIAPKSTYSYDGLTGTYVNGSDANTLKMFGDVNGDGNMVYVEYTCDQTNTHNLYRNVMAFDAASKPALTNAQILLSNIYPNPVDASGSARPCFKYQWSVINGLQYVTDVAITLTVQTQQIDPLTRAYQTETKALLNVSPRNVFNVWTMNGYGETERVQSTPPTVTALLP